MTKQFQIGLVGYAYEQLTPDSGCAPILCPFESRVFGIGRQVGSIFPVGSMQGYITFVISPAPPTQSSEKPMAAK